MRKKRGGGLVQNEVPPGTIELARSRVRPHLDFMRWVDFNLETFAVNCYIQGIIDTAETMLKRPELFTAPVVDTVLDYEI